MKFSYANPTVIHFGEGQIKVRHSIPAHHRVLVVFMGAVRSARTACWPRCSMR